MEKELKKTYAIIMLSILLIAVSATLIRVFVNNKIESDAYIKQKEKEIHYRDSIINRYELVNFSILEYNGIIEHQIDSLKRLKHNIYVTPTEQVSVNPEQAYKEMIKELNKYRNEKNK